MKSTYHSNLIPTTHFFKAKAKLVFIFYVSLYGKSRQLVGEGCLGLGAGCWQRGASLRFAGGSLYVGCTIV